MLLDSLHTVTQNLNYGCAGKSLLCSLILLRQLVYVIPGIGELALCQVVVLQYCTICEY